MKEDLFNTQDYLQAILRESEKRITAYPKIIKKYEKQGRPETEIDAEFKKMQRQCKLLDDIFTCIDLQIELDQDTAQKYLKELMRELKMRKTQYPRWVYFKRMDSDTAQREFSVWLSLTKWFASQYLGLNELPKSTRNFK